MSNKQWTLDDMVSMRGQVVVITGANTGIGYIACKTMLQHDAKVYMMSRDSQKSYDAVKRMKQETGKDAIELIPVDLSDLHSVRKAAETFLSKETKLDVLMNNAGVMMCPIDRLTKDGYDLQFGVNVLAHFHLTNLLLPALLATSAPRVINLSSIGHNAAPKGGFYWNTLKGPKKGTWVPVVKQFEPMKYYGQSKLGNILHSKELAKRYGDRGLVAIAAHPGVINSELKRELDPVSQFIYSVIGYTTTIGAVTQLYAANAPEATKHSGQYLVPLARVGTPSRYAQDQNLATKMWEWCESELKAF